MRNKQKLWRRAAASIKRQMIADGKHIRGQRYGRVARRIQAAAPTILPVPSILFQVLCIRAGYIQGELA